jgi:hypothetical protein
MQELRHIMFFFLSIILCSQGYSQALVNFHAENHSTKDTIIRLNNYPVIENSVRIHYQNQEISMQDFTIDYMNGEIRCRFPNKFDELQVFYRSYSYDFSKIPSYLSLLSEMKKQNISENSEISKPSIKYHPRDFKDMTENASVLNLKGSIARGVNVGSNQNANLSSNLNLQIDGDLGDGIMLRASLSDRNIPIQPDGTTQQIQEFDQVFIEVFNSDFRLIAGDFKVEEKKDAFLRYNRKSQGALVEGKIVDNKAGVQVKSSLGGAASRGKYMRMEIAGEEGNQGPYQLSGANNESWIIVLSGSEKVYLNGNLLTRGQSKDYTIDYNTGEINFTANRIISKDSRIIVEFEYSDRNYNRFVWLTNHEITTENSKYFVRWFSESDAKNQPVDQTMDADKRLFLSKIGDNINEAFYPTADSVGFDQGQIRYQIVDTVVNGVLYDSVYVYSIEPENAVYQVGFSLVGQNKGNYIRQINSANGKVYQWVVPEGGVPQGNYEPVSIIITPKKKQVLTMGGENQLNPKTHIYYELALSNNDINTFSSLDGSNDKGLALLSGIKQKLIARDAVKLNMDIKYQFINLDFVEFENFRETEFARDWNLNQSLPEINEHNGTLALDAIVGKNYTSNYKVDGIIRGNNYSGIKQFMLHRFQNAKWDIVFKGDLLNSEQEQITTRFLKHQFRVGRKLESLEIYAEEYQEWNHFLIRDSLTGSAFRFQELKFWLNQGVKSQNNWKIMYQYRLDELPNAVQLIQTSESHDVTASAKLLSGKHQQLETSLGYRKLNILSHEIPLGQDAQNNLLAQLRYNLRALNGGFQSTVFYSSGSGLEIKKDYAYIEVPAGQGVYTWRDYNENGQQELDEFEIANYSDEARYIRIAIPGKESVQSFNNQLIVALQLHPGKFRTDKKSNFLDRLSNQFSLQLSNKNTAQNWQEQYLPWSNMGDTNFVFLNNSLRNVLSFNRFSQLFSSDIIYQKFQSNSLLINGLDRQSNQITELKIRVSLSPQISVHNQGGIGNTSFDSQFFTSKDYRIQYEQNELSVNYQPDINMRLRVFGKFSHKENSLNRVFSRQYSPGIEYRNNQFAKGMLGIKLTYTYLEYNGSENSSLAYQMLESLLPGHNVVASFDFQKRLSNGLQINLNYQLRKPADSPIIHNGGIQVRAYF